MLWLTHLHRTQIVVPVAELPFRCSTSRRSHRKTSLIKRETSLNASISADISFLSSASGSVAASKDLPHLQQLITRRCGVSHRRLEALHPIKSLISMGWVRLVSCYTIYILRTTGTQLTQRILVTKGRDLHFARAWTMSSSLYVRDAQKMMIMSWICGRFRRRRRLVPRLSGKS